MTDLTEQDARQALNTHGLKPLKLWKFHEIDDWQLLVTLREHPDDEDKDQVVFSTGVEELGSQMELALGGTPDAMRAIFDGSANDETGARIALQTLFDQAQAAFPGLSKVSA